MFMQHNIGCGAPVRSFGFREADGAAGPQPSFFSSVAVPAALRRFARNEEIFGQQEPAEHVYKVVRGAVRVSRLLSDGRRQITAFCLAGGVFGLEIGATYASTAEAITDTTVLAVKRSRILKLAAEDREVAAELWTLTARHLESAQAHVLLLGRKSAQERVVTFLLGLAQGARTVQLPMSRQDIADYLGLTIETVSRTLTQLEEDEAIQRPSARQVVLRNPSALARLNA